MYFIVLDTQPVDACNLFSVILGCLFLVTSNALINYRNGLMKLSFGNMTLEMNIFNISKQPGDNYHNPIFYPLFFLLLLLFYLLKNDNKKMKK